MIPSSPLCPELECIFYEYQLLTEIACQILVKDLERRGRLPVLDAFQIIPTCRSKYINFAKQMYYDFLATATVLSATH
jgi:predicted kinase